MKCMCGKDAEWTGKHSLCQQCFDIMLSERGLSSDTEAESLGYLPHPGTFIQEAENVEPGCYIQSNIPVFPRFKDIVIGVERKKK
jgi:hypothetical protein